jgi:hypothetical protein
MRRAILGVIGIVALGVLAGCEPVSEPWVPGKQAEMLENERTRTEDQKAELRDRLSIYGGAYQ